MTGNGSGKARYPTWSQFAFCNFSQNHSVWPRSMKKLLTTFLFVAAVAVNLSAADKSKPNILFILADDSGIDDSGCYGSDRFKGKTPLRGRSRMALR